MTSVVHSPYTDAQIAAWLRGLLTIAWSDGDFDSHERDLIAAITQDELAPKVSIETFEPIGAQDLAAELGHDHLTAENFVRTAIMVALADGVYTLPEDKLLQDYCTALDVQTLALQSLRSTLYDPSSQAAPRAIAPSISSPKAGVPNPLQPIQEWMDGLEVHDPRVARFLCKMIPPQCPFERDIALFGRKIVHIPPLCKLNPLYEQLVGLRFRALSYLADDCGEDITPYC
ncbi:Mo-dependent nitrogenase C-terminal domain-containing protein [Geitlerinema sp. PCC 7407]|uniref:Mo-dependent nitrogenase C-terminal domain-containing protein n=1 Tax=Geitlerinema sp. PCC 7407 TaxID=1173025 RepID=UPI00029FF4E4|nr:Mo-dependent nitrogenase C-terminal domain-containing protein [Geitlerinema sp. PCC 7407]AFY66764.1 Mo-dependent nitrogenase family protein [Geitlerinema sp. PCC 7407]